MKISSVDVIRTFKVRSEQADTAVGGVPGIGQELTQTALDNADVVTVR
jgi:hypothetical protein